MHVSQHHLFAAPKGEKKSASPKKKGGKKKNPWSDSEESGGEVIDLSDNDMDGSFMENFIPRERGPRRQAGRLRTGGRDKSF